MLHVLTPVDATGGDVRPHGLKGGFLVLWRVAAVVDEDVDLWHRAHKALQEIWVSLVANKDAVGSTEVFILLIHLSAIG